MTAHIERTQIPSNADPNRTHLNRELIEFPEGVKNRTEAIQHRLDHAGITRKIGKNQVRVIRAMLSGTHEDMKRIESEGRLDEWCRDNVAWLRKTYGAENVVSVVLHLDETTPHLHATVVPIVTGERRKVREGKVVPGKKKYRTKNPSQPRLCADDVMNRAKLKEYQDTYAVAMSKYGLERGVEGSQARHISTQEFYRKQAVRQKELKESIESLTQTEKEKREAVEELQQKEQEAVSGLDRVEALKDEKLSELDKVQTELTEVKGQLKTEKLKGAAAEVGTNIIDGIGSMIGTSKVKRQQQEIDTLKSENQELQSKNEELTRTMSRERQEATQTHTELKKQLDKIQKWFPNVPLLIKWGEYCRNMGFTDDEAERIIRMEPVRFSGELYSSEHNQRFTVSDMEVRLEKRTDTVGAFRLTINGLDIVQWFRQKHRELLERLEIKVPARKQPFKGPKIGR